jgi:hypothetical protein
MSPGCTGCQPVRSRVSALEAGPSMVTKWPGSQSELRPPGPCTENGRRSTLARTLRVGRLRPDLTTIPLDGVEPSHVVLATRAGDNNRLLAAFRKAAEVHLTGPAPAG